MRKLALTLVMVLVGAANGLAQTPCSRTKPMTDQERLVQGEIQSRIDETIEAAVANDFAARTHYFAPDLTINLLDGSVLDLRQLEEQMRRESDWVLSVSDQTAIKIECLELKGREAALVTDQQYVRTVPDRKDGSPHELITNVRHLETWVYIPREGWLTKHIKELSQGPTYLDGEPYRTNLD
jgi:hypothetical protein